MSAEAAEAAVAAVTVVTADTPDPCVFDNALHAGSISQSIDQSDGAETDGTENTSEARTAPQQHTQNLTWCSTTRF